MSNFGGGVRNSAVSFSIGSKGYVGTGSPNNTGLNLQNDFWEFDPSTNIWTQKANYGGGPRLGAVCFSIGTKGYIGLGSDANMIYRDFWEYDPFTNIWTQMADFPGSLRHAAVGFSIGTKGYIGTGNAPTGGALQDFWEYDPSSDSWSQKSNFGGIARTEAVGFSIGNHGYIGTGWIPNGISFAVKASQGLAETHDKYQNYTLAKQQFLKTASLVDQANNPFLQAEIYNQVGTYLAIHKQYDKANQFCSSSLLYAQNIKNHRLIKDACYCLYKLNESKSDKTNALEYHKQYIAAKDSFENTNKMMEIGIIQARIEYEKHKVKNDFEIKHLNNELQSKIRSKNILVYTTIGLISILILLFYFIKDISDKRKALSHLNDQIKSNSELIMDQKLRLEESNDKLENFAYYAAHDIEAPINKIRHRIDLLQKEFSKSSAAIVPMINETLHLADYDARKLQKMINSLLYFSKIDKHIGNTNQIDLNILVKDITETLQYDSPTTEIQFKILRLPSIVADEGLIRSLFQNLIKNAIKYKKENEIAVITISGTNNDGFYKFYVQDNGIGIHLDQIDNIFEPFKQLSKTKEGSGMGLAIVKKIIEHYNGKIWVISTEGIGSTFHFTLKL